MNVEVDHPPRSVKSHFL